MLLRLLELRKIVIITPTHCQRAGYATSDQPPFFLHSLDLWGDPRFTFPRSVGAFLSRKCRQKQFHVYPLEHAHFSLKSE